MEGWSLGRQYLLTLLPKGKKVNMLAERAKAIK